MCNCKGWDIAYFPEYISVDQHFCRIAGDCGHVDNSLEEAAQEVAEAYKREIEWYQARAEEPEFDYAHLQKLVHEHQMWATLEHPDYKHYKE